ncbi:hypothetical protein BVY03_04395 [bacterium K02(2017)]|nr:hypothetical protein BVY03_04395 [bacterium K02(2017)]
MGQLQSVPLSRYLAPQSNQFVQQELSRLQADIVGANQRKLSGISRRLNQIESSFNIKGRKFLSPSEVQLNDRINLLDDQELVKIAGKSKAQFPDMIVIELASRVTPTSEMLTQGMQAIFDQEPLRLSSVEGLKFYLKEFEININQSGLLLELLKQGQDDIRIVPMLQALVEEYPQTFEQLHIPYVVSIVQRHPHLLNLLVKLKEYNPSFDLPTIYFRSNINESIKSNQTQTVSFDQGLNIVLGTESPIEQQSILGSFAPLQGIREKISDSLTFRSKQSKVEHAALKELEGQKLLNAIKVVAKKGFQSRSYSALQDAIFSKIDSVVVNGVRGVYSSYSDVFVPGTYKRGSRYKESGDANHDGFVDRTGMNVEHLWPQSYFRKRSPMKSDAHHLLPTFMHPNSQRGRLPFGEVEDFEVDYSTSAGAQKSDRLFEPPDSVKGQVARAMFYFYASYKNKNILPNKRVQEFWNKNLPTLMEWNRIFPPDAWELERNNRIEQFQGNRNPFVDDFRLVDRVGLSGFKWDVKSKRNQVQTEGGNNRRDRRNNNKKYKGNRSNKGNRSRNRNNKNKRNRSHRNGRR